MLRVRQTREQVQPVVDQGHRAAEQPATMQILRREATPAPLVLQFIEDVLAIGPVAIQLTRVRISCFSDVTSAAYSHSSWSASTSPKLSNGWAGSLRSLIAMPCASLRRNRIIRRCRLQPSRRRLVSLPCQP